MNDILERLQKISVVPNQNNGKFDEWLDQNDAIQFLADNINDDQFVVYASLPHVFIHTVTAPAKALEAPDIDDLLSWNSNPYYGWGVTFDFADPAGTHITSPLDMAGSKSLVGGEQLVFVRSFEGYPQRGSYVDVLQRFLHVFGLHHIEERNAFCRLDRLGDLYDAIQVRTVDSSEEREWGRAVTFDRQLLDEYAALTDCVLVRLFDFTRVDPKDFGGWSNKDEETCTVDDDFFFRFGIHKGHASYSRGCQVVRSRESRESIFERSKSGVEEDEKKYVSFIAQDWKNNRIEEISCNPSELASYFVESDQPYEVTPAYFRSEVLLKYKADREKYKLEERSISCRGSWYLKTFDLNDAGQVHTYLIYLGELPYEEQLHWRQYNEPPKGPISNRAFATDIEGKTYRGYNALGNVKRKITALQKRKVPWWRFRSKELFDKALYPFTQSADEWQDEIMNLDQLLVEGFDDKWLRRTAKTLGRSPELSFRSIRLIEDCLIGSGFEEDHARSITSPLRELHALRTTVKAHSTGQTLAQAKRDAITNHGSYRKHYVDLCARCDEALELVTEALNNAPNA